MSHSPKQQSLPFASDEPESADEPAVEAAPQEESGAEPGSLEWLKGKRVYVIDAHALIYQVFHALADAEMTSPTGQPVGAVHGFTRDVLELLEKHQPDCLFAAFDAPGENYRNRIYDEYKANRDSMPEEMRPQITNIHRMLKAMGVPILSVPDFEADDILATVAKHVEEAGGETTLVTNDKDCRQLITEKTKLYNIPKVSSTTKWLSKKTGEFDLIKSSIFSRLSVIRPTTSQAFP